MRTILKKNCMFVRSVVHTSTVTKRQYKALSTSLERYLMNSFIVLMYLLVTHGLPVNTQ
jgi:hypothetical protein